MKHKFIRRYITGLLIIAALMAVNAVQAIAQADSPAVSSAFPVLLALPYFIGTFLHWFKKYSMEGLQINFLQWMFTNLSGTVISLIVGLGALVSAYALNPAGYDISNLGTWIQVIMLGVGADTLNSVKSNTTP